MRRKVVHIAQLECISLDLEWHCVHFASLARIRVEQARLQLTSVSCALLDRISHFLVKFLRLIVPHVFLEPTVLRRVLVLSQIVPFA